MVKIIGLTGPIGSGKNEAAKILYKEGAFIIDVDKVAYTLYGPQLRVWGQLVKAFGSKILNQGGGINRKKLGEIVFSDKRKLRELDRIVHPRLKEAIIQIAEEARQKAKGKRQEAEGIIVINAAVLKEIGLIDYVDEVWVVLASAEKRLKRLVRAGFSKEEARRRVESQAS